MPTSNNKPATPNASIYLSRALELLEKPGPNHQPNSWITMREAIDQDGHACNPESEQAQAWCTIGVLKAVTHYDPVDPQKAYQYCLSILNLANPAYVATGSKSAQPELNDQAQSFEQVRRYFQRAIQTAMKWEAKTS